MELSREEVERRLAAVGYVADPQLAMAITLMRTLGRPLLLEGEAGVGKTEVGKALARMLERPLIRLQCYEGLDANAAVYEWNYQRQLLAIKIRESEDLSAEAKEAHIFHRDFLLERPLLKAIQAPEPAVLLIDEIDRADEEFEAYLLEVLSDFQISIPELGTITATSIPWVLLTSNRTREISDALRRRCLYHFVDYPNEAKELRIVQSACPESRLSSLLRSCASSRRCATRACASRQASPRRWTSQPRCLASACAICAADPAALADTLLCLLKTHEDQRALPREVVERLLGKVA